ncbi:MAG: ABC transporter ATP-binding protein [Verrucomicrobia bacterium]|nr:ABC transporter ATP-binding protein [Verrucomicrobiota bacterium]
MIRSREAEIFVKKVSTPILTVSDLCVVRGSTTILCDLAWEVRRGQHWVILGPNGSGKTSLLRVLTGYLSLTSGSVAVLGRIYGRSDWRELRKRIGIVSSALQLSIPPAEQAIETVISGKFAQLDLWAKITRPDEAEATRLLRLVGLAKLARREWIYLSQGERQRVLIARALMARPELLILDEPCAGLDPVAREHFLGFMERLGKKRHGPSLVLVTHHVEEITPAFSHVLMLRAGRSVVTGPVSATLNRHNLGRTFGTAVSLQRRGDRFFLSLTRAQSRSRNL